ncbi:MAG TPA: T9SS type A sorting domain-containing protein [Ignavibacteria bacterium]|nr:T9SS type A sorting domain-containing protein [Ignavibacteria bacterium]HRF64509.1 T9SS type A sorting domain-containing protein [Ignavibacteria bacterium]
MKRLLKITFILLFTIILLLGFAVPVNMSNGTWYQQFFPNLNGRVISDITFIDSLNGFAVTRLSSTNDTNYILKSTNSGDNWSIVYRQYTYSIAPFNKVKFLNKDTGFVGGNNLLKTTNAGLNWIALPLPAGSYSEDFYALNEDTLWFADHIPFDGGLFRSTNKGINWERQYDAGPAPNPDHVYMYNARIGFMTRSSNLLYKTTNSGVNWFTIPGGVYSDIYFIDSLTGWKSDPTPPASMKKTTDGGLNWTNQILPAGGIILTSNINKFNVLNKDTLWGAGGQVFYGGGKFRGMLYRTTNGGNNWLFQVPDTSFGIFSFGKIQYLNKNTGWTYGSAGYPVLIHTTNGGDTTFLVSLQQLSSEVPKEFMLFQNYPNPFNPVTKINYDLPKDSKVKIVIYVILGREVKRLVNSELKTAGSYIIDFNASNYASGVYFYRIEAEEPNGNKFVDSKKMVLLK